MLQPAPPPPVVVVVAAAVAAAAVQQQQQMMSSAWGGGVCSMCIVPTAAVSVETPSLSCGVHTPQFLRVYVGAPHLIL